VNDSEQVRRFLWDGEIIAMDASTDSGNTASKRVLEKSGMQFQRREVVEGLDTVFYRLLRDNWKSQSQ
jgi:RimJ/RimL family protein N-acetyltransferase